MTSLSKFILLFLFSIWASIGLAATDESPTSCRSIDLRVERLVDPLGLDEAKPRLSWRLQDERGGAKQSAFRVQVKRVPSGSDETGEVVWDTGKVESGAQLSIYGGEPLQPFHQYAWTVDVWDANGRLGRSSREARFEMGMMRPTNWEGDWISDSIDEKIKPAPYFRRAWTSVRPIRSARAYIAAAGLYELHINGERVGNQRLDPAFTRFDRRVLYVTHDVTQRLRSGENAIGVILGNGWFNHQSQAVWNFDKAPWRGRPAFCLDLRIVYEDGSVEVISSGKDWKTALGPIEFNSIYTAEHYDARKELSDWSKGGFDDSDWSEVIFRSAPTENIVAQALHPIREVERIPARSLSRIDERTYVFDLGRNIAGVSEVVVSGERGTTLRVKHGERLGEDGRVDLSNIDVYHEPLDESDPFQTDIFTLSGEGEERFKARFNYKGFQYVEVTSDAPIQLTQESVAGLFMHSDVPRVGAIDSSNETVNRIALAAESSYLSNLYGFPTDCPQREKNGWTGDGHIASEVGLYSFDAITVYEKWLDDHRDEQQPNGVLPAIIPTSGWGYEWANGPDWTSSLAILPWNLYLFYGDSRALEENYDSIKRYVDMIAERSPEGLTSWGIGDWVPVKSQSPVELTSSIYFFVDARILANTAAILEKPEDERIYRALAERIRKAINGKYLNRTTGIYGSGLQTELSVPLFWDVVPEELRERVAENLARRVVADGKQIDVGLLGSKALLNALSENGQAQLAYELASRETYPSWGWWIANGATTLYENWPIDADSDISMNHIMFGEIGAWFYKALGGIRPDPNEPGFKRILLEPHFVEGLDRFSAYHQSPYGEIRSEWERDDGRVRYDVVVPPNSTARLRLPANYRLAALSAATEEQLQVSPTAGVDRYQDWNLPAGQYVFEIQL